MEDESILAEVDCSKTYSGGQAFQVKYFKLGLFKINFKKLGVVPEALSDTYNSVSKALVAINSYISGREEHFAAVARKKSVKRKIKVES